MKTDKEFLNGIYAKARIYEQEVENKKTNLLKNNLKLSYSFAMLMFVSVIGILGYRTLKQPDNTPSEISSIELGIDKRGIAFQGEELELNVIEGYVQKDNKNKSYITVNIRNIINYKDDFMKDLSVNSNIRIYYENDLEYFEENIVEKEVMTLYIDKDENGKCFLIDIELKR